MTEEVKFTPGEWYQSHRKNDEGMYSTQVYTEDGETIATLHWYPKPIQNGRIGTYREANARLIAAAPDMLREMESLAKALEDTGHEPPESFYRAIAKAYGRTV